MKRSGELKRKKPMAQRGLSSRSKLTNRSAAEKPDDYQFNSTFKKRPPVPQKHTGSSLGTKAPLAQRTPLKAKREEPRRQAPERIQQERIAPKASDKPDALEKQHMHRVSRMPCLVCKGRSTIHHVTGYADRMGRIRRSHKCVVPLCAKHHQKVFDPIDSDPVSVEGLGHQKFFQKHGYDLFAIGNRLWEETLREINSV